MCLAFNLYFIHKHPHRLHQIKCQRSHLFVTTILSYEHQHNVTRASCVLSDTHTHIAFFNRFLPIPCCSVTLCRVLYSRPLFILLRCLFVCLFECERRLSYLSEDSRINIWIDATKHPRKMANKMNGTYTDRKGTEM